MLKIGIIGLGDIAQKAYLPVYSAMKGEVEFHFFTRDQKKLKALGNQYRFEHMHETLESLVNSGIKGAFVHAATESHEDIVEMLLRRDIHVFVDKPITDNFSGAKRLVELAEEKRLNLMTGFNRRYAPSYVKLKEVAEPNLILVQKHRKNLPGEVRSFIFDDFIHVVDTMRFLFPYEIEDLVVKGRLNEGALYHIVVQFSDAKGATAIGIMNRENGATEEIAEVMGPIEKRTVYNVAKLVISKDMEQIEARSGDWEPTLVKRGFAQMVEDFIQAVRSNNSPKVTGMDALETHRICEEIIERLTEGISNSKIRTLSR